VDPNTLELDLTIDDRGAYTRQFLESLGKPAIGAPAR
jgi:hypothetical protein